MSRRRPRPIPALTIAALLAAAVVAPAPATAEIATFTSRVGDLAITGDVSGFDGELVRLATDYGELTLRLADVDCSGAGCPDIGAYIPVLSLSGAHRMASVILPALIDGFARDSGLAASDRGLQSDWREIALLGADGRVSAYLRLRDGGTDGGLDDLIAGQSDILLAARALTGDEIAAARAAGLGRLDSSSAVRTLAYDAFVAVAAPGQPVAAISMADLALVLAGRVDNWSALGGDNLPIRLYLADDDSGQVAGVVGTLLGDDGVARADAIRSADPAALATAIAADPAALGLLPFDAFGESQPLILRDDCGASAIPRAANVRTGDYPLTAPLYLYLPMRRLPQVGRDFLAWLSGPEAQLTLRRVNVLGADAVPIPLDQQGERLAAAITAAGPEVPLAELQRLVRILGPMVRLTPTFRFQEGSTLLEPASRSNVLQLAHALAIGRHAGQRVLLVGFSDGRGPAAPNRDLALARAEAVQREVLSALGGTLPDGVTLDVEAFGEALPMGCDDTAWGQRMNRRVELWVSAG